MKDPKKEILLYENIYYKFTLQRRISDKIDLFQQKTSVYKFPICIDFGGGGKEQNRQTVILMFSRENPLGFRYNRRFRLECNLKYLPSIANFTTFSLPSMPTTTLTLNSAVDLIPFAPFQSKFLGQRDILHPIFFSLLWSSTSTAVRFRKS